MARPNPVNDRWHRVVQEGVAAPLASLGFGPGKTTWSCPLDGVVWTADVQRWKYDRKDDKQLAINIHIEVPGFGAMVNPALCDDRALTTRLGRMAEGRDYWSRVYRPAWWRLDKRRAAARQDAANV